jgi:HD-like signal output (HDOD) protein
MTNPSIHLPPTLHPKLQDLLLQPDHLLPPFRKSVVSLLDLVSSETTSTQDLARIIMNDPGLSSRILRLANSIAYSPLTMINSIHHAVTWLGIDTLRTTIGTIKLLDELLPSIKYSPHLMRLLTSSILAAAQSAEFGHALELHDTPQLYTRTLLYNLVDMMLVYQAPELYDALMTIRHTQQTTLTDADELSVLGITRRRYGELLAQLWHLPTDYLTQAHERHDPLETLPPTPWTSHTAQRTGLVVSTNLLATELTGSNHPERIAALRTIIQVGCRLSPTKTELLFTQAIDKGHQVLQSTGMSQDMPATADSTTPDPVSDETITHDVAQFQTASAQSHDVNSLLTQFIQALQHTLHFTRIALALLDPRDTSRLIGRYLVGADPQQYLPPFTGSLHTDHPLFLTVLKRIDPILISPADRHLRAQLSPHFTQVWRPGACLIGPIRVNQRPIGLIYADFGPDSSTIPPQTLTHYHLFYTILSEGLHRFVRS